MKIFIFCLISIIPVINLSAQQPKSKPATEPNKPVPLKTANDTAQYVLGAYIGQYINNNGFVINNADLFIKGLNDGIANKDFLVPAEKISAKIKEYQLTNSIERNKIIEQQLFTEIKKQPGIGMLPSGVCYSIIKTGTGKRPLVKDSITIHVKGFLPDGHVFDDTYQKKTPYKLTPANLIPGMNEMVQIMPAGSLWRIYIPSSQAFGEKGLQGLIPPFSAVVYEVELIEVK